MFHTEYPNFLVNLCWQTQDIDCLDGRDFAIVKTYGLAELCYHCSTLGPVWASGP